MQWRAVRGGRGGSAAPLFISALHGEGIVFFFQPEDKISINIIFGHRDNTDFRTKSLAKLVDISFIGMLLSTDTLQ